MRDLYNHSQSIVSTDPRLHTKSKLTVAGQRKFMDVRVHNRPRFLEPMLERPPTPPRFNSVMDNYGSQRSPVHCSPQLKSIASKELVFAGPLPTENINGGQGMQSL